MTKVAIGGAALATIATACGAGGTDDTADDTANETANATAEPAQETATAPVEIDPVVYEAVVIETYPHDPTSYTQGLEFVDGLLLESTGQVGRSSIRLVDPFTGGVEQMAPIDTIFGEGATVVDDEVWQLTWRDGVLIIHDLDDLSEIRRQTYDGEGWGLCDAGDRLIMTDGSAELAFRNRETFEVEDRVTVTLDGNPVEALNELECVDGLVWANIFQSETVLQIDPSSGGVIGTADLTDLVPNGFSGDANLVLNGIAHNPDTGRFWLTGKEWPVMYELEFRPAEDR